MDAEIDNLPLGEVIVKSGNPVDVILEAAQDIQSDLIVMGSHCSKANVPMSLGTVAQKVLNYSKVPTFLVPNTHIDLSHQANGQQLHLW